MTEPGQNGTRLLSLRARGSIAYYATVLLGCLAMGAVGMLPFLALGGYDNLLYRAAVFGLVFGCGPPLVIRAAKWAESRATRGQRHG